MLADSLSLSLSLSHTHTTQCSLYLTQYHEDLLYVLNQLVEPLQGTVLIFAPKRGNTFEGFVAKAREQHLWQIEVIERYDDDVWSLHEKALQENECNGEPCLDGEGRQEKQNTYDPDVHYSLLLKMKKRRDGEQNDS